MRMDKLTSRFQQALAEAQSLAVGRDHPQMEPVHLMQALLDQDGGSTVPLLQQAGVNVDVLRNRLDAHLLAGSALSDADAALGMVTMLRRTLSFMGPELEALSADVTRIKGGLYPL